jgi:hypothetical protein
VWTGPAVMEVGGEGPTDAGGTSRAGGWELRMGPTVRGVEGEECTGSTGGGVRMGQQWGRGADGTAMLGIRGEEGINCAGGGR